MIGIFLLIVGCSKLDDRQRFKENIPEQTAEEVLETMLKNANEADIDYLIYQWLTTEYILPNEL